MTAYEIVIGLEVHVELGTATKMFCCCPTTFGAPPNTQVCPVCLGLPGALPTPNQRALEYAIRAALALNCRINRDTKFDRKNYHYPDLPKGYQISQFDQPLAEDGYVDIEVDGVTRRIGIERLHLEEDAGKSLHDQAVGGSLIDLNRSGVPLIEIVSRPDLRSPEEARAYLQELRNIILYTGVSDVKMEEGSLRCDANVSLRAKGSSQFGNKVEVKNMNSFRSVKLALEYEASRQAAVLDQGGSVPQETRHWNERAGETTASRSKEEAHDYRYFPEPDLVSVAIDEDWLARVRAELPELPAARRARYTGLGLSPYDAGVLVDERALADYFDGVLAAGTEPKLAANWVTSELLGQLKGMGRGIADSPVGPAALAELIGLLEKGTINGKTAKEVLTAMLESGKSAAQLVEERGLVQISDQGAIQAVIGHVLAANAKVVADYRGGKSSALGFLVGQVMKETRGRANPGTVNQLLREALDANQE